jgi:hypothetical protein
MSTSSEEPHRCTNCDQALNADKIVWLDLNWRTNQYRREPWSQGESQGLYAFGATCASKMIKRGRPRKYGDTKAKRMNLVIAEDVRELLLDLKGFGVLSMSEIVNTAVREWASSRGK